MRAIKFIKNGEEHYIGDVSKEYVDKKTEDRQVKFFSIPTVGDSIKSLWEYLNNYKDDEEIQCFIDNNDFYGWGWRHRIITSMTVNYSTDGPFGTIIAEGNDQVMYIEYSTIAGEPDVDTYCDSIEIKDKCKVKFFPMPQVGDDLGDILGHYFEGMNLRPKEEYLIFLDYVSPDEGPENEGFRHVINIGWNENGGYIQIKRGGSTKTIYASGYDQGDFTCTSIVDENCHDELITTVTQDQNDGTMVICNEGNPHDGTVIHITCSDYYDNTLGKVSFDNGTTRHPLIYPSGDPLLGHQFSMRGDNYFFTLTGLVLNRKVYVWDFYSAVNAE